MEIMTHSNILEHLSYHCIQLALILCVHRQPPQFRKPHEARSKQARLLAKVTPSSMHPAQYIASAALFVGGGQALTVCGSKAFISAASTLNCANRSPMPTCSMSTSAETARLLVTQVLEPQPFWRFFEEVSAVPRASRHETAILDYIKRFAKDRELPWRQDAAGNLVVERGGMNGGEKAMTVMIQGHVDMVTEKNSGVSHNFLEDPIKLVVDGDWLTADGTTLGADNGMGVAAALALLDMPVSSGMTLPPLECLFTVEEEIGLLGAFSLDASKIKGRTMLNLDSTEWGSLIIGCAGGGDTLITLPVPEQFVDSATYKPYRVSVDGLMGGHSGINIHEDRANAVVLMVRLLGSLLDSVPAIQLVDISGGDKHNAIPREAFATVLLPTGTTEIKALAQETVARVLSELKLEFGKEKSLSAHLDEGTEDVARGKETGGVLRCLEHEGARRLLSLLQLLPHGVVKMSHDLEGLVETSTNLASIAPVAGTAQGSNPTEGCKDSGEVKAFQVLCSSRSSLGPSLEQVRRRIKTTAELCGASKVDLRRAYPGWQPNLDSTVLQVARGCLQRMLAPDKKPVVTTLHAGLECGVIGSKVAGMDMVSFGPTIDGAHSPDEKVEIASVDKFWKLVLAILEDLATRGQPSASC